MYRSGTTPTVYDKETDNRIIELANFAFRNEYMYIKDLDVGQLKRYLYKNSDIMNGFSETHDYVRDKVIKFIIEKEKAGIYPIRDYKREAKPAEEYVAIKDFLLERGINIYDENGNLKSIGQVSTEINKIKLSEEDNKKITTAINEYHELKRKNSPNKHVFVSDLERSRRRSELHKLEPQISYPKTIIIPKNTYKKNDA